MCFAYFSSHCSNLIMWQSLCDCTFFQSYFTFQDQHIVIDIHFVRGTCHQDLRLQFVSSKWVVCEHFLALLVVVRNAPSPSCRQKSLFSLFLTLHSGSRSVFFSCSSSLFFERERDRGGSEKIKGKRERKGDKGRQKELPKARRRVWCPVGLGLLRIEGGCASSLLAVFSSFNY